MSLAFGLTVLTMAYAIGHISGCHLNPAVSVGLCAGGRFPAGELLPYIVAQVLGAIVGGGVLYLIASGKAGFDLSGGLRLERLSASTRPAATRCCAALRLPRSCMTFMFLIIILGATDTRAPAGFAPHRDRPRPDADPPDQHPGHQHLGEPGAQHRPGAVRRRLGALAAVAVLGGADRRWAGGWRPVQGASRNSP